MIEHIKTLRDRKQLGEYPFTEIDEYQLQLEVFFLEQIIHNEKERKEYYDRWWHQQRYCGVEFPMSLENLLICASKT